MADTWDGGARSARRKTREIEWPTLAVLAGTYLAWIMATTWLASWSLGLAIVVAALAIAQFSSLQHEVLHGHPFADQRLNEALVYPGLTLFVPYRRFRDTHLAHHFDPALTDPYDDPESNFVDPEIWGRLSRPMRRLMRWNNTLLGRMAMGPALSIWRCLRDDWRAIRAGDRAVGAAWVWHAGSLALVLVWLLSVGRMPLWAYPIAAYFGYSLLKIRTYLEHRAHHRPRARSAIVEDAGLFALLFLNNNLHAVHHKHPHQPWYRLPALYRAHRERYLNRCEYYHYPSYLAIFRRHLLRAKDPVPHPLFRRR